MKGAAEYFGPSRRWVAGAAIILLTLSPLLLGSDYLRFVAVLILINAIAATGVNLSMGYCGLVSVGHCRISCDWRLRGRVRRGSRFDQRRDRDRGWRRCGRPRRPGHWFADPSAQPALHRDGDLRIWPSHQSRRSQLDRGDRRAERHRGQLHRPYSVSKHPARRFILPAAALFLASLWVAACAGQSRLGGAFLAIKESEIAARSMGISVERYKMIAFAMSSIMGGAAGGLYALVSGYVNPDAFVFQVSVCWSRCAWPVGSAGYPDRSLVPRS